MGEKTLTTHGCGKSWLQRGNETGHCGGCHQTFEGTALFDAHFRRLQDGRIECKDPAEMEFRGFPLTFDGTHGSGTWRRTLSRQVPGASEGVPALLGAGADSDAPVSTPVGGVL
jgi:hypothetical protein